MMMTPNGACMISNGQTMSGLATQLSNQFDRPIIDQTGLTGKYDLKLRYDPTSLPGGRGGMFMMGPPPVRRLAAPMEAADQPRKSASRLRAFSQPYRNSSD
jgi:uncharacterized protein (TIGR03435 family)